MHLFSAPLSQRFVESPFAAVTPVTCMCVAVNLRPLLHKHETIIKALAAFSFIYLPGSFPVQTVSFQPKYFGYRKNKKHVYLWSDHLLSNNLVFYLNLISCIFQHGLFLDTLSCLVWWFSRMTIVTPISSGVPQGLIQGPYFFLSLGSTFIKWHFSSLLHGWLLDFSPFESYSL